MSPLQWLFETAPWPRRWECGEWSQAHGLTHVGSDLVIAAAYFAIPVALIFFARRRADLPFPRIFWLFGAFIASCGTSHLVDALMFYHPTYRLLTGVKIVTAVVSWATLIALIPVLPKALALPSIARTNAQLQAENAARRQTQEELRQRNEALLHKTEELEQFVHTIGHDLKSPLVTMGGFLALARKDLEQGRTEDLMDNLARVDRAADRLGHLTQGLLELARAGKGAGELEHVDVLGLVRGIVQELRTRPEFARVRFQVAPDLPWIRADRERLSTLFENLLTNAAIYGCPGGDGEVRIGAVSRDDEVHYFVADDGPGIPREYQRAVFRLFQRISRDRASSGVGLALVEKVARVHGGSCWVDSEPGRGATFWVALPLRPNQREAQLTTGGTIGAEPC